MLFKHFLYRHIRLDKNEPFYIGVGTKTIKHDTYWEREYARAYSKYRDNPIWNAIVKKSDYEVEILYESNSYGEILQKEVDFIKLYGRIDRQTGCLSNLTDGGEGCLGRQWTEARRQHMSKMLKGKTRVMSNPEKHRENTSKALKGYKHSDKSKENMRKAQQYYPIAQYTKDGRFVRQFTSAGDAARTLNVKNSNIHNCLCGICKFAYGYKWIKLY